MLAGSLPLLLWSPIVRSVQWLNTVGAEASSRRTPPQAEARANMLVVQRTSSADEPIDSATSTVVGEDRGYTIEICSIVYMHARLPRVGGVELSPLQ